MLVFTKGNTGLGTVKITDKHVGLSPSVYFITGKNSFCVDRDAVLPFLLYPTVVVSTV